MLLAVEAFSWAALEPPLIIQQTQQRREGLPKGGGAELSQLTGPSLHLGLSPHPTPAPFLCPSVAPDFLS